MDRDEGIIALKATTRGRWRRCRRRGNMQGRGVCREKGDEDEWVREGAGADGMRVEQGGDGGEGEGGVDEGSEGGSVEWGIGWAKLGVDEGEDLAMAADIDECAQAGVPLAAGGLSLLLLDCWAGGPSPLVDRSHLGWIVELDHLFRWGRSLELMELGTRDGDEWLGDDFGIVGLGHWGLEVEEMSAW